MMSNINLRISSSISILVAQQLLLITEASNNKHKELSSIIAYQLYDTIDWLRMNLKSETIKEIIEKVCSQIPHKFEGTHELEYIENYVECLFEDAELEYP